MVSLSSLFNFRKSNSSVLGIDIGSSAIKVVQIMKKNGQAVLETYGELALGPYGGGTVGQAVMLPTEKIAEALSDLLKEKEVNITTRKCGLSIPFASSLMTEITLPQVSANQLAVMVPIEARKYVPVPISEVMLDWTVIPKSETSAGSEEQAPLGGKAPVPMIDVLVVAIHNETLKKYQDIVAMAGLEASFFEIEIFSTMRAVLDQSLAPVMIMDIGAATTKLYIVERGVVKSSHTINRGSQDITLTISKSLGLPVEQSEIMKRKMGVTGEDKTLTEIISLTLDYVFEDANRSLLAFEKKHNKAVGKVILVGGGSALKGLSELAKANFKTEALAGDPFSKLACPAFLQEVLNQTGPEFAVAIGLALRRLSEEE